ncbi:DNA replication and repair protein RecF [Gordonia araii NBRC 100433]|uniref:DNA replication and repair protein RecF n=1 Tax=Gordonia araii NBRC 100433 TaxID=1073574 RepID=G7H7A6_9ACTN|nr:DNA replication/repair protein RecF [Gordonia araii]NNG99021.1 DNA replication/repair protein RecF [Gordonia araii NBRC 100433]GAB11731.1 DNA replication and repair protein RecF [Gordonia araii NBRC 100433]
MFVRQLSLRDFRSWHELTLELTAEPVILVGRNGFGKTNVLEALYYLTNLRSHRVSSDAALVADGAQSARIGATVHNEGRELSVEITLVATGANKVALNTRPVRRHREVVGVLRSVMFAPEDLLLVRGEPADRRRFADDLVAGQGPAAVAAKADYDRVLRQRAALLKTAGAAMRRGGADADSVVSTLDVWDGQLARFGAQVTAHRITTVNELQPHFAAAYAAIAPHSRPASVTYRSAIGPEVADESGVARPVEEIEELLLGALSESRGKEIDRGVCLIGPHRDDLDIRLGDQLAKGYASHGESWSLALSLRLATVELARADGVEPVIMLDDVFAELDARRREHLATFTAEAEQLLITAAVPEDLPAAVRGRRLSVEMREDEDGSTLRRRSVLVADDKLAVDD